MAGALRRFLVDFSKIYNPRNPAFHPWDTKDSKQKFENEIHDKHTNVVCRARQHTAVELEELKQEFTTIAHNYYSGKRLYSEREEAAIPHLATFKV